MKILKEKKIEFKIYFVGQILDKKYYKKLKTYINDNNLVNNIYFTDALSIEETYYILKNSLFTLSVYMVSNLGNVFLESIRIGTPILAINQKKSLDVFPKEIFHNSFDNPNSLSKNIKLLLENDDVRKKLNYNSINYSNKFLKTWDQKLEIEMNLILIMNNVDTIKLSNKFISISVIWLIILLGFSFPISASLPIILNLGSSTPLNIFLRASYLTLSIILIFYVFYKKNKIEFSLPCFFLICFWIIYLIRLIYDISYRGIVPSLYSPFYVYSISIGSIFIPVISIILCAKYIYFKKLVILSYLIIINRTY